MKEATVSKFIFMIKYSIGVDFSSEDFHACLSVIDMVQKVTVKSSSKFSNNQKGFEAFTPWFGVLHQPLLKIIENRISTKI